MKIEIEDLARFSANLRKKGVPASIRSTETAFLATQIFKNNYSKMSYSNIKEVLGAIYIKNKDHKKEFEQAFQDTFGVPENELNKITLKNLFKNNKKPGQNEIHSSNYKMEQSSLNLKKNPKMKLNKLKENNIDFKPPLKDYNSMDLRENSLMERDINKLDFFEPELFELCQKIGRKIANQRVRRNKHAKNTKIDIRRSIRKNLKYGGVFIDLEKTKPHLKKNQHFFLSDVSGSCDWISNWFFLYGLRCPEII